MSTCVKRERERIIRKEGRDGQLAIKGRTHFPNCCPDRGLGFRPHETQVIHTHPPAIWISHIPYAFFS